MPVFAQESRFTKSPEGRAGRGLEKERQREGEKERKKVRKREKESVPPP